MNLLPKTHEEFGEKEYWNAFFKKRGPRSFEWYGKYPELCLLLNKYIKQKDVILVVGCGNSILSVDMYTVGYRQITNIDISHVVIRQMQEHYSTECPEMEFLQMDALEMSFSDGQFSVVLDKGTLDALMPDNSEETSKRIDKFFSEIDRVLRIGGRYICISLLQEHILAKLLDFFPTAGWMFRVCRCTEVEQKSKDDGDTHGFPVFFVVCTKFKKLPNAEPVLELAGNQILRVSSPEEVKTSVKSLQQSAMVCSRLRQGNIAKQGEVFLELYQPGGTTPRYTVHVLDQLYARENARRFAAFVVPQGRETEWLFSTPEGRATLIKSAGFDRLAVVTLHREHTYNGLDAVQEELNESILLLAPTEPGNFRKIPFLSVGTDVGQREVCYQGHSDISGDFVVEELERDGGLLFRRLIFLNNQSVVQSEARLKILKSRKGKPKKMVDTGYLACEHHIYMTMGIALVAPDVAEFNVAVIGLGGGGLCTYLQNFFQKIKITAVDIDPAMLEVATEYFGLVQNDRLEVYIRDGVHFIHQAAEKGTSYHAILFDVDSKNLESGMNCPPPQFLEPSLLHSVKKCLGTKGLFVLNLVCRATSMKELALKNLKSAFKSICSYKLEQEVNEILFCTNNTMEDDKSWKTQIENASDKVNTIAKKKKFQTGDLIDVVHLVEALKIS